MTSDLDQRSNAGQGATQDAQDATTSDQGASQLPRDKAYRGVKLLHDPQRNKGTAFTAEERDILGLRGLLPPRVFDQEGQAMRVMENLRRKTTDLERYIFLVALQDRNEMLFYRVVTDHIEELMPYIYTPTVGKACELYGHIFRRPRGLWLSIEDRGRVAQIIDNWPHDDVRIIVVTDGERILGLGDLGAAGMGIPIGKLALYSVCAGIHPRQCLPITLDVGTDNRQFLHDPLYIGLPRRRVRGAEYDAFVSEFMDAVVARFPRALVQLEDFATANAFTLLARYRDKVCTFDDDIQGTGAVALAGLYSALRITGKAMSDQRVLFLGAGEAGIGIGHTISAALVQEGLSLDEARARSWFFDTTGLVCASRENLPEHKRAFAHEHEFIDDFLAAIEALEPTVLIGVSGAPRTFNRAVIEAMSKNAERPVIFALSNPTSKAECTAQQAYQWSRGKAIFASGSPFAPVDFEGKTLVPGQGNNAYIFPGVGLGAIASQTRHVTDEMFLVAAQVLASTVSDDDLALGRVYPSLSRIRAVSADIAVAVAEVAFARGLAGIERPEDLEGYIRSQMFEPDYERFA